MKTPNKQALEKTASNGIGESSPKTEKIRCKCTYDCRCPNSKYHKGPPKKKSLQSLLSFKKEEQPEGRHKVRAPELEYSKCTCADTKVTGKKKFSKSKVPCTKEAECSCTVPTNTVPLRHKITDLDNALKTHGRGKKRKTKNIQQKSIQINEIYEDPETKKKSIVTLTEKSKLKIEIKTFCDDTRRLDKIKKKEHKKDSDVSPKFSESFKKEKKLKEKKGPKEKKPKKEKKHRGLFGCFKRKRPPPTENKSNSGPRRQSDVSVLFQSNEKQHCKDGPCLGIQTFTKTQKTGEGIVNTNTVLFPENFLGGINQKAGCGKCKDITVQLDQQNKEIDGIRRSVTECLRILKSGGQPVYMMAMTERSNPNYYTVYSHSTNKHKQVGRECKVSDHTYDLEYKVRDWMTHGSLKHPHEQRNREETTHGHKSNKKSKIDKDAKTHGKTRKAIDKFDTELEEYLKHCSRDFQVYRSKEPKPHKVKKSSSKVSKKSKKSEKKSKSKKGSVQEPQCDREARDCQCGPDCVNLSVQTSNASSEPSKKSKKDKKHKKDKKIKKSKSKSKGVESTGDSSSIATEKSDDAAASIDPKEKQKITPSKKPGCFGNFIKCILCRPY